MNLKSYLPSVKTPALAYFLATFLLAACSETPEEKAAREAREVAEKAAAAEAEMVSLAQTEAATRFKEGVRAWDGVWQGDVTSFSLVGMSSMGDCRKIHIYVRIDGGSELEGTLFYLVNSQGQMRWPTLDSGAFDRRGTAFPGWYSQEMNEIDKERCIKFTSESGGKFSSGPYKVIK